MHRSPHFGASVDFAEHRGYTAGRRHPPRGLEAVRPDRPLLYKGVRGGHQRQLRRACSTSPSRWAFGSRGITKLEYGQILAGCLTYMVHRQRDRVGFAAFDDDIVEYVPPSAKHMEMTLHILDRLKPSKPGQLAPPMKKLAEHFARRGVLVLVSDFYEDPQAVLEAVAPLRFRGHDMIVFHVLDPGRDRVQLRPGVGVRGSRERRADSGRAGGAGGAVPRADPGAQRGAAIEVLGAAGRLRAAQYRDAARPGAVHATLVRCANRSDADDRDGEIAMEMGMGS